MADGDEVEDVDSEMKTSSSLQHMLSVIAEERKRETTSFSISGDYELIPDGTVKFWTSLFERYFLTNETSDGTRDDMLFYVRKEKAEHRLLPKAEIEVYRKDSKKQPSFDDTTINWEETVYLNIILHQFVYTMTCAVCTRTAEKHLQCLKKYSQRVYASPSKRRMDSKGTQEEICYPNIFFTVDNFEEAFTDIVVQDSELVTVQLIASDRDGAYQGVIFLGSIRYDNLKKVYDARASLTSKMAQKMSLGWINKTHKRVEFMRMRGPGGKGFAEIAVSRVKGSGAETPDLENFPSDDFESDQQQQNGYTQRRMSDPSQAIKSFMFRSVKKSRSETENVDAIGNEQEVEAGTLHDELEDAEQYNGFWGKSFGQAWHWFKERRRANSVSLNAYLTYVTLPWHRIIADVLDPKEPPIM
ncbi:uncharacterized protein KIAA0930 homolog isoform X2 [Dreissena polymorpha]|uniref:KIAA0930 n=1 Tax=Dreissena polymorpha TaxID=45954 RepID=A0A9D4DPA6_DREPO|nr:uncharacterized protein KIAA0930 homolog isoform X1 [Dreissena polymorpha]XP_052235779.1 uncharacterized protein KIAA0930 homolog isoform X2 [Dreissena polymorpha]KAH3752598.1 hypothetical protein DPMN_187219 [Dreissena polymorpha]